MLPEVTGEDLAAALDFVAAGLLERAEITTPPVDALFLARRLDLDVVRDDQQVGRARFVRLGGARQRNPRGTILLHSDPRTERRHWAVAHEIGESVAWQVFHALRIDPREASADTRETVANHLAGRLLLPTAWLAADGPACGWELFELKARYRTASHELIARRMLDFPVPLIVTIVDLQKITWRRSNIGGRVPSLWEVERECWRSVHHGAQPADAASGPCRVRGWPVHEEGWKREILRTELNADSQDTEFSDEPVWPNQD